MLADSIPEYQIRDGGNDIQAQGMREGNDRPLGNETATPPPDNYIHGGMDPNPAPLGDHE